MALKNDLYDSQTSRFKGDSSMSSLKYVGEPEPESKGAIWLRGTLFVAFLASFMLFLFGRDSKPTVTTDSNGITEVLKNEVFNSTPDSKLLRDMGDWMARMGYQGLTTDELIDLRKKGVTATFTSRIRELGYEPTLEELVQLAQHDVSATFASMMHSLGYKDLKIEDLTRLRIHGVTAHFTSNMHDLGYKNITPDELIQLKDAKVSISMVKRLNKDRVQPATIEELVRYGISNQ
ncbi:hypothetical protein EP331_13520 [bacterium]|nr:MAG: hypothetical protein EP331_13520 [bacterium]